VKLGSVLILPTAALRTTAAALRLLASTGQRLADLLAPDAPAPQPAPPPAHPASQRTPATPPPADPAHVDLAGLAARPTPQVIAALETLGTVELGDLYEHESKHRRRRAVLDAITAATAPPQTGSQADLPGLDDVRVPDELVYSTQTPQR
jgi:hypothetical protein